MVTGLHGAYLRRELIARVGRHRVNSLIQQGTLRRLWPGVVVESERLRDPCTRAAAAVLAHGRHAVLAGPTAARLQGCDAIDCAITHLLVPYGHASRSRDGLAVHNGPLRGDDVDVVDDLPVLCLERVVADLLCNARPRDAIAVADQALAAQQPALRDSWRARVEERLRRRADPRGTRRGAALLGLSSGRAESPPESWLLLEVVELGFPPPRANWSLCGPNGREIYRLDLAWPEDRIAVEYYGYVVHVEREAEDRLRVADIERRGWTVIVADAADLRDSRRLEQALRRAFEARGHQGRW
jgi:hypothetical protein